MRKVTAPYLFAFCVVHFCAVPAITAAATTPMLASVVRDATLLEHTPNFTDLYIIRILHKRKPVRILCNASSCYKQRSQFLIA